MHKKGTRNDSARQHNNLYFQQGYDHNLDQIQFLDIIIDAVYQVNGVAEYTCLYDL